MPGIIQLVAAISDEVVTMLAAGNYPPLSSGKILIGRNNQADQDTPPRILFVPTKSKFGPRDPSSASRVSQNQPYSAEAHRQIQQRSIATELITFEARCWAAATSTASNDPSDVDDFDATQALYHAVIGAAQKVAAGAFAIGDGEWVDSRETATQRLHLGREFVFGLTFFTPVLADLLPLAPANVSGVLSNVMQTPDGNSGTGCG